MAKVELLLYTSAVLFVIGLMVVIVKQNAIVVLMGIELMLNAANLNFIAFSQQHSDVDGPLFVLFVIMIAAAEAAVGLSIIIRVYRHYHTAVLDKVNEMKH